MAQRIKLYSKSEANTFDIAVKRTDTSLSSIAGIILRATSFKICALKTGIPPPLCDLFNTAHRTIIKGILRQERYGSCLRNKFKNQEDKQ